MARRRAEEERAEAFFLGERRRRRWIQSAMREQRDQSSGQTHQHDHVAIVRDRIAIETLQPSELAGFAWRSEGEVHIRSVEGPEPVEQVGRIEPGRGDRWITTTRLLDGRLDGFRRL